MKEKREGLKLETLAVLADIHSNVFALEAILEDIGSRNIKRIINLGDIFYGPIDPKKTGDIINKNSWTTVQGNQDRYLYESTPDDISSNPTLKFVLAELDDNALEWLKSCPSTKIINDTILACHGAPASDTTYLLEDISPGFPILKSDADICLMLKETKQEVILCAHTHIPRTVKLSDEKLVLNPGSVGIPAYNDDLPGFHKMETGSPHARYAILPKTENLWITEHIQVPYDFIRAAKEAENNGRPDWANLLRTGRS